MWTQTKHQKTRHQEETSAEKAAQKSGFPENRVLKQGELPKQKQSKPKR